jgi:hypothetical protein
MLTKEKVKKTIDRLPDSFTVDQVVEELVVLDKIEKGLKEVEEGKVYSTQQVKDQLKKWLKSIGLTDLLMISKYCRVH